MRPLRSIVASFLGALFLASCGGGGLSSGSGYAPQMLHAKVQRGTIIALNLVTTITKAQMSKGLYGQVIDQIGGPPQCDVLLYAIKYQTVGVNGETGNAEGFFVPSTGCSGPFPLVGYAHGTNLVKKQLISDPSTTSKTWTPPDQDPYVVAGIFAAHGYAVAATDYLGLGFSTYPYHPYLHAASEASAVIDSLRAARNAATQLGIALSRHVFLTGHSQGGQSALATQRTIEAQNAREFDLRGDAPSSGPYALSQTFEDALRTQSQDAPILAAYILTGYQKVYGNVYTDPTTVFKQPYATGIDSLLPVQTFKQEAALEGTTLPLKLGALLQPAFVHSFLNDPNSPARHDTADNDLLSGWTAKAPLYLCGGDRDPEVEFKNAQLAQAYFSARHVNVQLVDVNAFIPKSVPIVDYHVVVALFCLPLARTYFFDPIR